MRFSRPCYDKPHRCPGWAGGGTRSARVDRCENGSVTTLPKIHETHGYYTVGEHPANNWWMFGRCIGGVIDAEGNRSEPCGVVTWPYALRWLDWRYVIVWKLYYGVIRELKWKWEDRRG